ncbi:hypothetical protein B0A48_15829 [Cryoendolithus antarcticus]|uniref:Uncharacterized protein n=1 Tax=Cryoendolithus antarcticus TaxID=1507870 RepID=A0A1V8SHQ3_9PEZI|nr:hypothetical protein B0A48_15829 [Cryoendolithus antarcticus]
MATAMADSYAYSRSSSFSAARSPDTASPIYPDRAIRPLPNRKLKSRLSPEQQNTIVYPASPPPIAAPVNQAPQESNARPATNGEAHHHHHHHHHDHDHDQQEVHDHCTCKHDDLDSGDEEVEFDHPDHRYEPLSAMQPNGKPPLEPVQRRLVEASRSGKAAAGTGSAASSADGYESFENTSNKKKRKIPLSSTSSVHQSTLSAEMASMGINNDGAADEHHAVQYQQQHGAAAPSGTGISGAGRGRYGRPSGRRPLASWTASSTNANTVSGRAPMRTGETDGRQAADSNTGGIISQAIKTAAEQGPLTPQKGKENISLLHQSASTSVTPKTQFTFTCESDSASKMADQAQEAAYRAGFATPTPSNSAPRAPNGAPALRRATNQGTQTLPPRSSNSGPPPRAAQPPPAPQQPAPAKPRRRRNPTKEYALAARQRKLQQEYTNYHHRPSPSAKDLWICEFCEYEDIFGVPPRALIRSYEIKDRAERKKAAEKRRLLEKAKMKNRKGKKGKNKGNNSNAAAAAPPVQGDLSYDPNIPPLEGEDYYDDDEYGDEYEPVGAEGDPYPDEGDPGDYYPPPPAPTPVLGAVQPRGGGGRKEPG